MVKKKMILILVTLLIIWIVGNLVYCTLLQDWFRPFAARSCQKAALRIEKKFYLPNGEFDYQRYQNFLLQEFKSLDQEERGELNGEEFIYYILFLRTRSIEEICDIVPVLEQHKSTSGGVAWGESFGVWPLMTTIDCYMSIGDACSEVLKYHGRLKKPDDM